MDREATACVKATSGSVDSSYLILLFLTILFLSQVYQSYPVVRVCCSIVRKSFPTVRQIYGKILTVFFILSCYSFRAFS